MKGQASLEAIFILASVLLIATFFIVQGEGSSNSINGISAARTGAENAINELVVENGVKIEIESMSMDESDNIKIILDFWGEDVPGSKIEQKVREDALNYLYQAFNGDFPEEPSPVSTKHHKFNVTVIAGRVAR